MRQRVAIRRIFFLEHLLLLLLFWVAGFIFVWDFLTHSRLLSASASTEKAQRPPQSRGQPRGSPQTFPPTPLHLLWPRGAGAAPVRAAPCRCALTAERRERDTEALGAGEAKAPAHP